MSNNVFKDIPYAQWLENTLQEMVHLPVKGVCLAATTDNGAIYNSYYNVGMTDKITIAGVIQQDAMLDTLSANEYINIEADEEDDDETE